MKWFAHVFAATAVLLLANAAEAQIASSGPNTSDVSKSEQKNSDAPVVSTKTLTESQAMSRIEDAGYSSVSGLRRDANGMWRGKAVKGGANANVSIDVQGNVNAEK